MNTQFYVSLGSFVGSDYKNSHKHIPGIIEKINADGFEFLMMRSWYEKLGEVIFDFKSAGLKFPVFHMDKNIGEFISRNESGDTERAEALFEHNCVTACELGSKKLVLHLWGGLPSDKNIDFNIETFGKLQEKAEEYHLALTVENVVCNTHNPLTHLKRLAWLYPEIQFTLDTKFAAFHYQLGDYCTPEHNWLWKKHFITHLHISDYKGGYMEWERLKGLHPGEGNTDFAALFSFMKSVRYGGTITLETTVNPSEDHVILTNKSIEFIRKGLL